MSEDVVYKFSDEQRKAIAQRFSHQGWRLNNLYFIKDKDGKIVPFKMNKAQLEFFQGMHRRNVILKARQLGLSTFMALYALDCCMFTGHFKAGIIDKTIGDAKEKLAKVQFAWECFDRLDLLEKRWGENGGAVRFITRDIKMKLGEEGRDGIIKPVVDRSTSVRFGNGSELSVGTDFRGGTLNLLHISELANICRKSAIRADSIKTGAFPAVERGVCVLESTHEGGKFGLNWEIMKLAMDRAKEGGTLTEREYKFFFFNWSYDDSYATEGEGYFKEETLGYFSRLENDHGLKFSEAQMRWYEGERAFYRSAMLQEYPSIPEEAFERIAANAIYGSEVRESKDAGRWGSEYSVDPIKPIVCFWDLGWSDFQVCIFVQFDGEKIKVFDYIVRNKKDISWFFAQVRDREQVYGQRVFLHVLPHDARQASKQTGRDYTSYFEDAGITQYMVMSRTPNVWLGIQHLRSIFKRLEFHERLKADITVPQSDGSVMQYPTVMESLEQHSTKLTGVGEDEDDTIFSHGADAMRYIAEFLMNGGMEQLSGYHGGERYMLQQANPECFLNSGSPEMPTVIW